MQVENPFHAVDLGDVHRKYDQWCRLLPRVDPFYAIKCNGDALMVDSLLSLSTGFDCASEAEIRYVIVTSVCMGVWVVDT